MKLGYLYGFIAAAMIAFVNAAYAHEGDLSTIDLDKFVKVYNENLDKVPGFVKKNFGNERINLYVDGEKFVGLVGQNGTIKEYSRGGVEKPTLNVYTTGETIDQLLDGEKGILETIKDKSIRYEGVGFGGKIKFGIIKFLQGILLRK